VVAIDDATLSGDGSTESSWSAMASVGNSGVVGRFMAPGVCVGAEGESGGNDATLAGDGSTASSWSAMASVGNSGVVGRFMAPGVGLGAEEERCGEVSCGTELRVWEPGAAPIRCHAIAKYRHSDSAPIAAANLYVTCLDAPSLDATRFDNANLNQETIGVKERSGTFSGAVSTPYIPGPSFFALSPFTAGGAATIMVGEAAIGITRGSTL